MPSRNRFEGVGSAGRTERGHDRFATAPQVEPVGRTGQRSRDASGTPENRRWGTSQRQVATVKDGNRAAVGGAASDRRVTRQQPYAVCDRRRRTAEEVGQPLAMAGRTNAMSPRDKFALSPQSPNERAVDWARSLQRSPPGQVWLASGLVFASARWHSTRPAASSAAAPLYSVSQLAFAAPPARARGGPPGGRPFPTSGPARRT